MLYKIELTDFFTSAFSVDCMIFGYEDGQLKVLLIERGVEPFNHYWAIPGDLVYPNEDLPDAASRILLELTGLADVPMHQSKSFGAPNRHPQGRVITISYFALIRISDFEIKASSWAEKAMWVAVNDVPQLAFDHNLILDSTYELLKQKLNADPICFDLLPEKFTLMELQQLYEYAFNTILDKANFRKKLKSIPLIQLNESQQNVKHRPAKLFKYDASAYTASEKNDGFQFNL
ncbi:MAG: NUDIX hydrolase [Fluviicola sp.]|nr:NUDIX hydrolase [Fluviicola sp.]MBP6271241.1 NUDIX hydrolase [Fluviicola sp.]